MRRMLRIDLISDVACPWCAIGLAGLQQALDQLDGELAVELRCQPFELNPDMGPEGRDIVEYLGEKYGKSPQDIAQTQAMIRERGAAVGFSFGPRTRTWNTFDAHRLLHWAGLQGAGQQLALKRCLLQAYHGDGLNPSDREVLADAAQKAGLSREEALTVLDDGRFADDVRAAEREWQQKGIRAVPSVVVDGRHLIQGGQPPAVYLQALRQIAAETAA
ncbi:MAG: DsbA family oxidoreductase [Burkholderiaceae bacterium]|nr:DsbA family oxidoreductase [Rhodoferax sp.]MCP5286672.1 DsbA family oxidoreductase [Burkholderiaceae bacterium]